MLGFADRHSRASGSDVYRQHSVLGEGGEGYLLPLVLSGLPCKCRSVRPYTLGYQWTVACYRRIRCVVLQHLIIILIYLQYRG